MKFPFAPALARTLLLSPDPAAWRLPAGPDPDPHPGQHHGHLLCGDPERPLPRRTGALQQEVEALLARLNKEISTYDPGSLISRFNQGTGQPPGHPGHHGEDCATGH